MRYFVPSVAILLHELACGASQHRSFLSNGEYRNLITAARLQRLGVVAGWPDLQFAGLDRRMVFLELKRRGGRLSKSAPRLGARQQSACASLNRP